MSSQAPRSMLTALFLASALAACGGEDPIAPPVPTTLAAAFTTSASGTAGGAATPLPIVIVRDQRGDPMAGVQVAFSVTGGGGTITGAVQTTDANGVAALGAWTLGATAGTNTVAATSGSLASVIFTAAGAAGPPLSATKTAGDDQTATVDVRVPIPPRVIVKDIHGNVVPGVTVNFAVIFAAPNAMAGGSVSNAAPVTNEFGEASVEWTLARLAGTNRLTATVSGLPVVTFTAMGTPGPVAVVDVHPISFGILIGDTVTLRAVPRDQHLNVISGLATSWTQRAPVASISGVGLLTGLGDGHATIEASIGGVTSNHGGAGVSVYGAVDSTSFLWKPGAQPTIGWTEATLGVGAIRCVDLYSFGSGNFTSALRWTPAVSDPTIVRVILSYSNVFERHCFEGLRPGTVTVRGSFGGATASKTLSVP